MNERTRYLLDSNVWIAILNNSSAYVLKQFDVHLGADLYFCDVVKTELIFGAFKSQRQHSNAAIARANQMTLVTANTREFMRVENLTIEDWSQPALQ